MHGKPLRMMTAVVVASIMNLPQANLLLLFILISKSQLKKLYFHLLISSPTYTIRQRSWALTTTLAPKKVLEADNYSKGLALCVVGGLCKITLYTGRPPYQLATLSVTNQWSHIIEGG